MSSTARLQWLDALRGFTMLLVVVNHVYGKCFDASLTRSHLMSVCLLFRMPLFFFISGFLAYKATATWNLDDTLRMAWRKVQVQVVPTVVAMTAFVALTASHFWVSMGSAWTSPMKSGYWFTLVLLQMFIIYYAFSFTLRRIVTHFGLKAEVAEPAAMLLLWLLAVAGYASMYMPALTSWHKADFWQATSLSECVRYVHFFIFGNMVHRYWPQFCRLLDTRWFIPLVVTMAFVGAGDYIVWHNLRLAWANLPRTMAMYALVVMCLATFRHYASAFSSATWAGRALQFVGVRTLDVYLLHYFFLPKLTFVGTWLKAHPTSFVVDASLACAVTAVVMAFTLAASAVLRVSPFLKKWMFGRG